MTDIWVCSTCHSVNRQRNNRCYKCGASQDQATGEGAGLRVEQALKTRAYVRYRSAWLRGLIAAVLILAVAALGLVIMLASVDTALWVRGQVASVVGGARFNEAELLRRTQNLVTPALVRLGLAVAALVYFGAWLSRVVMNIPALGGGVPNTSPTRAFVYPLIPLVNLIKVPGIVQDALYRVDPKAGGFFMLALAWFGLVGSWIISFFAGWFVNLQLASAAANARTPEELTSSIQSAFDIQFAVDVLTTLLVTGGAVILVVVMMRIERRSRARDDEIKAAASTVAATVATAGGPIQPAPEPVIEPVIESLASGAKESPAGDVTTAAPVHGVPMMEALRPAELREAPPGGSHLDITVRRLGSIVATLDDDDPEEITLDDVRQAAGALARAGGTATVTRADPDDTTTALAEAVVAALQAGGVRTQVLPD
jgi:hypothetical protein